MTTTASRFKPIYADIWQHDVDDWESVNPMECYRFKNGYVQLARGGYWFPYHGDFDSLKVMVNLVKPHVLV